MGFFSITDDLASSLGGSWETLQTAGQRSKSAGSACCPLFTGGHGLDLGVALTGTQALKQEGHIVPGTSRVQLAPRSLVFFFYQLWGSVLLLSRTVVAKSTHCGWHRQVCHQVMCSR